MSALKSKSLLMIIVLSLSLLASTPQASTAIKTKSVLLILPLEPERPVISRVVEGFRSVMISESRPRLNVFVEHYDKLNFPHDEFEKDLQDWIINKYRSHEIVAIIAGGITSFNFAKKLRDKICPGAPLVFWGVNKYDLKNLTLDQSTTGLIFSYDLEKTFAAALSLLPETKRIALINGDSWIEKMNRSSIDRVLDQFRGRLELIDLSGLPIDDLKTRLASLPDQTIVYFNAMMLDDKGRRYLPREAFQILAKISNRPIFSVHEGLIGDGIVGGYLLLQRGFIQRLFATHEKALF